MFLKMIRPHPHPKVSNYSNSLHTFRIKLFFNESVQNVVLSVSKFGQIFLQNWDIKISGKNGQISLQE